jgi:hypothetical protein
MTRGESSSQERYWRTYPTLFIYIFQQYIHFQHKHKKNVKRSLSKDERRRKRISCTQVEAEGQRRVPQTHARIPRRVFKTM